MRRVLQIVCLVGALWLPGLAWSAAAGAQSPAATDRQQAPSLAPTPPGFEAIRSFRSEIRLDKDGSVDVTETIVYDFGGQRRHGIERYIPVRFPWAGPTPDDATYDRVTPLEDFSVSTSAGTPGGEKTDEISGNFYARIGDPDQTITGAHTYTLRYTLRGVVNGFADHDELYLNVTGNGWRVPIDSTTADVRLPGDARQVACYAGPAESNLGCASISADGTTVRAEQGPMATGSGLTVVVALPKGIITDTQPILEEQFSLRRAFSLTGGTAVAGGGLLLVAGGLIGMLLWRNGRDRQFAGGSVEASFGNTTGQDVPVPLVGRLPDTVEFVPPEGVRPGHLGTLWDEQANDLDVTAMIIDLAVRGYLRIEEIAETTTNAFGMSRESTDYRFVRLKPAGPELLSAEQRCLDAIFQDGDSVTLSSLKQQFRPRLSLIEGALIDDALAAGWFPTAPRTVQTYWTFIGLVVLAVGGALTYLAARHTHLGLVALPVPTAGLAIMALAHRFPRRTAKGTAMLRRVRGFKMIFDAGEGERQRWAENKHLFSQYLPYAIVFGCADKWAQTFADLGLTPAEMGVGTWYVSPYGFNPITFGYAMSSFSTIATGTIAAAAPSSTSGGSGFGGGGFSGGGFGGGGGGSW